MYIKKEMLFILFMAINTLDIPLLEISIFSFAVFGANMSISVATSLAIRQLLKQLGKTTKHITKFIERFVEFLVSINRMQDFLKCDEVSMREIEFMNDDSIAIRIDHSNFFWGFDKYESSKDSKSLKHNQIHIRFNQDPFRRSK